MSHHVDHEHHQQHHHRHYVGGVTTPSPAGHHGTGQHRGAHEGHQGHEGGGSMHAMVMHAGHSETVLFSWWVIDSPTSMLVSVLGTALLAAVFEGLKYYREYLFWQSVTAAGGERGALPLLPTDRLGDQQELPRSQSAGSARRAAGMLDRLHLIQTLLQAFQLLLSYALMLIFMTMNVWLCLAILVGDCLGFFLFAWKRPTVVDTMETCH